MAANEATALDIEFDESKSGSFRAPHSEFHAPAVRTSRGDEWITLPIRQQDNPVRTTRGAVRMTTVIVAVNYARVPKKRPKLSARNIRERDGTRCQYTGRVLHRDEGSLDHVVPRSRERALFVSPRACPTQGEKLIRKLGRIANDSGSELAKQQFGGGWTAGSLSGCASILSLMRLQYHAETEVAEGGGQAKTLWTVNVRPYLTPLVRNGIAI